MTTKVLAQDGEYKILRIDDWKYQVTKGNTVVIETLSFDGIKQSINPCSPVYWMISKATKALGR